jgi:hypothetical protein
MIKNSYDFDKIKLLKKEYIKTNKKYNKYRQIGGTVIGEKTALLQKKMERIKKALETFGSNIDLPNYENLDKGLDAIKVGIEENARKIGDPQLMAQKKQSDFLNLMTHVDQYITTSPSQGQGNLQILFNRMPKLVEQIPIEEMKTDFLGLTYKLEQSITKFNESAEKRLSEEDLLYVQKKEELEVNIQKLIQKTTMINAKIEELKESIKKIDKYSDLDDFELDLSWFVQNNNPIRISNYPSELAEMSALTDLTMIKSDSSLPIESIGHLSDFIDDRVGTIENLSAAELINPNFEDIGSISGILTIDKLIGIIDSLNKKIMEQRDATIRARLEKEVEEKKKEAGDILEKKRKSLESYIESIKVASTSVILEYLKILGISFTVETINEYVTKIESLSIITDIETIDTEIITLRQKITKDVGEVIAKIEEIISEYNATVTNYDAQLSALKLTNQLIDPNTKFAGDGRKNAILQFYQRLVEQPQFEPQNKENKDYIKAKKLYDENKILEASALEKQKTIKEKEKEKKKYKEKYKEWLPILDKIEKIFTGLLSQKGGSVSYMEYFNTITKIYDNINQFKIAYNKFIIVAKEFNLKYIQMFNHQSYIQSYINLILLNSNYKIYTNVSKGTIEYYYKQINKLFKLCEEAFKNNTLSGKNILGYFYKYHYVTLKILNQFLGKLLIKWLPQSKSEQNSNKLLIDRASAVLSSQAIPIQGTLKRKPSVLIVQGASVENALPENITVKRGLFLFNLFKDIIDAYSLVGTPPVATYLRINDYGKSERTVVFKKEESNVDKLIKNELQVCDIKNPIVAAKTPINDRDATKYAQAQEQVSNIEFNKIFDTEGFNDNATLAMYMGIPNYLSRGQSIMMITYGYSGVGKTFTIFGGAENEGVLQTALRNIKEKESIHMRTYEIYGRALPYKAGWLGLTSEQYDQTIYTYKYNKAEEAVLDGNGLKGADINEYIKGIKGSNIDTYQEMTNQRITDFQSNFVEEIDKVRVLQGRIKKTINNPVSSRSIMVYEFKIELSNGKWVRFVIMDLPGKEDIKNTYITEDSVAENTMKLKTDPQSVTSIYYKRAVQAACFLNPLFISIFPMIAKELINFVRSEQKYLSVFTDHNISSKHKCSKERTEGKVEFAYDETISLKEEIESYHNYTKDDYKTELLRFLPETIRDSVIKKDFDTLKNLLYTKDFITCLIASEIIKCIIKKNEIQILVDFYTKYIIDTNVTVIGENKNNASLPFEGFFINENILGLVEVLKERLNKNNPQKIKPYTYTDGTSTILPNFFSNQMKLRDTNSYINLTEKPIKLYDDESELVKTVRSSYDQSKKPCDHTVVDDSMFNIYDDEMIAQSYFIRNLIREPHKIFGISLTGSYHLLSNENTYVQQFNEFHYNGAQYKIKLETDIKNYGNPKAEYDFDPKYLNKSIKDWIEESYVFNRSFSKNPPIKQIMEAYFGEESDGTDTINNFYLFYVVSNNNLEKCANQINLLNGSKDFIDAINNYVKA